VQRECGHHHQCMHDDWLHDVCDDAGAHIPGSPAAGHRCAGRRFGARLQGSRPVRGHRCGRHHPSARGRRRGAHPARKRWLGGRWARWRRWWLGWPPSHCCSLAILDEQPARRTYSVRYRGRPAASQPPKAQWIEAFSCACGLAAVEFGWQDGQMILTNTPPR
jgi:hypothetical protein